jgi:P4 family phage/plasmid primase-like protien
LAFVAQENQGYVLLPSLAGSAAFFFYGAGRNGKSVLADLCRDIVGDDLSVSMTLESLTSNRFSTASLVGKKLNVCNEDESKYLKSDKFKAVVSGEFISAERKFEGTFNFRPQAKHVFCTNSQPRFDELNYGLRRRVKILPFYRRIPNEDKDILLADKLRAELPGIVAFAIAGARRLKDNNYEFSDESSEAMRRELGEFEETISPPTRFVRENYRLDDEGFVANSTLYDHYVEWCKLNGNKPLNSMNFHKDVTKNSGAKSYLKKVGGEVMRGKRLTDVRTSGYDESTLL